MAMLSRAGACVHGGAICLHAATIGAKPPRRGGSSLSMMILLMLQAAAPGEVAAFDLRRLNDGRAARRCAEGQGEEIVVCARPDETVRHRVAVLPPAPVEPILPKAETKLFGDVTGALTTEGATMPDGTQSNRAMVKLKVPF